MVTRDGDTNLTEMVTRDGDTDLQHREVHGTAPLERGFYSRYQARRFSRAEPNKHGGFQGRNLTST